MLKKLVIDQFVIIDHQEMTFEKGLTIFTGQTGAGKSIILGAMGLILGEPSKPDAIRAGAEESKFEAHFNPVHEHPIWNFLKSKRFITDDNVREFQVHRTMRRDGKDTIRLNGKEITLEDLFEIGTNLIEIHGQFANQSLLGPSNQLNLLDLAGNFDSVYFENVRNALSKVRQYTNELEEEKLFLAKHRGKELQRIEQLVSRFESVGMKKGHMAYIRDEYQRLRTAKETMEAFQSILGRLIAGNGVVVSLSAANETLRGQKHLERDKMGMLEEVLEKSLKYARDSVQEMNTLIPEYEVDLNPLRELEEVLRVLREVGQQNKIKFEALEEFYLMLRGKLDRVINGPEKLKEIEKNLADAKKEYIEHANTLSGLRKEAAKLLSKNITAEMEPLKLPKAEFICIVEAKPENPWTDKGFDEITFTARMNPGTPFTPISETASGGELARMVLAMKVVLQDVQVTPTLVFDEVDTGIGGSAAAAVGDRISMLSANTQVIVITHSPQVASRGDQHYFISKRTEGETTISSVTDLDLEKRINEISRMLAGNKITEASQQAARSLIEEASVNAKSYRKVPSAAEIASHPPQ